MDIAFVDPNAARKRGPTKQWTEKEIEEELKKLDEKIEE
jgi:hypothetical protein